MMALALFAFVFGVVALVWCMSLGSRLGKAATVCDALEARLRACETRQNDADDRLHQIDPDSAPNRHGRRKRASELRRAANRARRDGHRGRRAA